MKYELTKQLKDAGFPGSEYWDFDDDLSEVFVDTSGGLKTVPTLSELIEACGAGFTQLTEHNGHKGGDKYYVATESFYDDLGINREGKGKTPEESVARLWLALNKK